MATIRRRRRATGDTWQVDFRDGTGVRRRLTAPTKEAAEVLFAEKVKASRQAQPPMQDANISFSEYADRWLEQLAGEVAPKTLESYAGMVRCYLRPAFGPMKLRALHRGHVKALLAHKRTDGLSPNSLRLSRVTASCLFADAIEDGVLTSNPAVGISRRGRRHAGAISVSERVKKIRPMSYEQLAALLATAQAEGPRRDAALVLTLAEAGLRPGEALALRWPDLDLAGRTLHVARAVSCGEVKATKTEETRIVDLTGRVAAALSDLQVHAEADALAAGRDAGAWVFPSAAGAPLEAKAVARRFRALLARAGLPHFRLYDLRHTYATDLLAEGAPLTYVAAQLGHAKPTTTLAFYAHWLPRGDQKYIDALERARTATPAPPAAPEDARA